MKKMKVNMGLKIIAKPHASAAIQAANAKALPFWHIYIHCKNTMNANKNDVMRYFCHKLCCFRVFLQSGVEIAHRVDQLFFYFGAWYFWDNKGKQCVPFWKNKTLQIMKKEAANQNINNWQTTLSRSSYWSFPEKMHFWKCRLFIGSLVH